MKKAIAAVSYSEQNHILLFKKTQTKPKYIKSIKKKSLKASDLL